MVEGNSTNTYSFFSRSLLLNHLEAQSSKAKLLLFITPIGIVAYAFTLSWDVNLCRNSCILWKTDFNFETDQVLQGMTHQLDQEVLAL